MTIKKVETLSLESFQDFGEFTNMTNPTGYYLEGPCHQFYRDQILYPNNNVAPVAFSILQVKHLDELVVGSMEYHNYTAEAMLPLDGDVVVCLVPAHSNPLRADEARAFLIPKGTMIKIRTGVWHALPISVEESHTNMLVVLPERAYHNDLHLEALDSKIKLEL